MATQRQKVQVGIFLTVCGALLAGALVLVSGWQREQTVPYFIEFDESVSGLFPGAAVSYRGVPVGRVTDIAVLPTNRVRVRVETRPSMIQVRNGMTARLSTAGITGQLYIDLTGGEPAGKPLPAYSRLPSEPSLFANLATELPELLSSINSVLVRIDKALGEEGSIATIVQDVKTLVPVVNTTVTALGTQAQTVLEHTDRILQQDVRPLMAELKTTAQTAQRVLESTDTSLKTALTSGTRAFQQIDKQLATLDLKSTNNRLQLTLQHVAQLAEQLGQSSTEFNRTLQHLRDNTTNAEFYVRQAARNLQETLRSADEFFDYLERDPAALLRGKRAPAPAANGPQR